MTGEAGGIIPARGGSKGIPRKNVALVGGRPLLFWTTSEARKCRSLDRVIVSTEDNEIADLARSLGAEVPFSRPAGLAQDETPGIAPIIHATEWLEEHEGYRPEYVVALQPTSPLRSADDITSALKLAEEKDADAVVSVTPAHNHPYLAKRVLNDGRIQEFIPQERRYGGRQEFPPVYTLNGAIYLVKRSVLLQEGTFYTDRTFAYVMPPERSIDIDDPWDLHLADLTLRAGAANAGD